ACHETRMGHSVREALLWLEKLGAPCISASSCSQSEKVMSLGPTNYWGKKGNTLPDTRGKQPRVFPSQTPARSTVYFVWPNAQPAPETRNALDKAAQSIGYLGKSASLVRVAISYAPPEPNYIPDSAGAETLRVFGQG